MDLNKVYDAFKSDQTQPIKLKDCYTDKDGFPNAKAFDDFVKEIEDDSYRLILITVNLAKANLKGYAFGNYILRRFINSLNNCYAFRIQGNKFNLVVKDEYLEDVNKLLQAENEYYEIYRGELKQALDPRELRSQIQKGVELMYQDKTSKKTHKYQEETSIVGDKGNTPLELQEGFHKKHRITMWYTKIMVSITEPTFKEFTVYVYPAEFRPPMASLPVVVIVDDMIKYRAYYDTSVKFGVNGIMFTISSRFDREGKLNTSIFQMGEGKVDFKVEPHEGVCIPANFGKRVDTREIYPIKQNVKGYCDFVVLEDDEVTVNADGIIEKDGKRYTVHMDDQFVELIKLSE